MKTTLLTSIGCLFLAFASIGQMRQNGISTQSINTATPNQTTIEEQAVQRITPARTSNELINRAPCIDTLLFEDFQSKTIPASWINLDLDGAADVNGRPQDWFITFDPQSTIPGDTNWVTASSSWLTPAGAANNVLILDAVQPCANTVLRWDSAPFEGPIYMDGYEVRVSTTGTNVADFTTTLFTAAEGIGSTTNTSSGTVHTSFNGTNGLLQTWEVSLGAYDNQTIYIAFFHDSNDDNLIQVDNIFMGLSVDYDVAVNSVSTEPYYATPLNQVTPRTFSAELGMLTGTSVTNPTSNVEVFQGATSVFTDAPTAASLNAGSTVTLTTAAYTPMSIDTYTATFSASAVETDPDLSNNNDTLYFAVSDSVFATEDGVVDGALSIGGGNSGFLGNQYNIVTADELTSVTFVLTNPSAGDTVVGAIYDMTGTTPNQIIGYTDTLFVSSTAQAEYTLNIQGGALSLTPGSYVVGLQEESSQSLTLGTNTTYFNAGMAWVFFGGNWGNNEDYGYSNTYFMRANFGPYCAEVSADYSQTSTDLTVDFTDASTNMDAWSWDFGDGNTSTQQNPTHTYATGGTYTVCLIATSACDADTVCTTVTVSDCVSPTSSFTETLSSNGVVDFTSTSTSNGTTTFAWDFGDGGTSTDENPSYTYTANGTYTVCLTVTDSCGIDTTCNTINVNTIGLDENSLVDQLEIYPVPAYESMTISHLTSGENVKIELLNNLGQVVKVMQSEGLETVELDVRSIVDGYYHLRVSNAHITGTRAVLIKQ
ncbi:MAG: PKD domain-containing protein [Flavobacteriales bacterium]|nr:PKD domain-containing protein [Flavobacteriales bacterium]